MARFAACKCRSSLLTFAVACAALAASSATGADVRSDFDCDGIDDLVIGVPGESGEVPQEGAIHVIDGTVAGLDTFWGSLMLTQDTPGVRGEAGRALFGADLARGDFDGDGCSDLAVGAQYKAVNNQSQAGWVYVFYGSDAGLTPDRHEVWHQGISGIDDEPEEDDFFGRALAAGDFDGDGYDELVVSVLGDEMLHVLQGSATGLTTAGSQSVFQRGLTLAVGNFDSDSFEDLVVGDWGATVSGHPGAGRATILYGSPEGLNEGESEEWHQDSPGIAGVSEHMDGFSGALAVGDFNGDEYDDLAAGAWTENVFEDRSSYHHGAVNVLFGSSAGLTANGNQLWHQNSGGVIGVAELEDQFGEALAAGDFNGDEYDDLAIGVPGEGLGEGFSTHAQGVVHILRGTSEGLTAVGDQLWHQNNGLPGVAESGDSFGGSLVVGDFNHDGFLDLAIGAPGEGIGNEINAGAVHVIHGGSSGLNTAGNRLFHQDAWGIDDTAEANDEFGSCRQ